ncbi:hypothetical protein ABZP36_021029 [Zizania latifolia]
MEPRGATCRSGMLLLLATILTAAASASASSIGDKCAACKAVAAELEIGISSEKPRNHLDLRNRLNSKGQREGKVIDYRVSELRVVELLDDLCNKMQDYTLQKLESGEKGWVKVADWNSFKNENKAAARAHSKNLSTFCGRYDISCTLSEWIKTSSAESGNVSRALCEDISKHCQSTRYVIRRRHLGGASVCLVTVRSASCFFVTMKTHERAANLALAALSLAPLVVKVNPNVNVILTACLTVYVGCYRSVKPTPPSETMSNEHAMRFPLVGSAMLLSLFLLFKFLSKDLVNAVLTAYFFILGIAALWGLVLFLATLNFVFSVDRFILYQNRKLPVLYSKTMNTIALYKEVIQPTLSKVRAGLFFYDIFWVFFTPVMVSVAKSFDAPIKLLFPTADAARPFSMLGLGDIVIPGIFVALALRFDVSRGIKNRYFNSAFLGYMVGLTVTIIVMNWFQAAQPALLYIVPGVIGFVAVHCLWNGEVKPLLEYNESKAEGEEAGEEDTDSKQNKKDE